MLLLTGICLIALIATLWTISRYIAWMHHLHLGQYIRDYGPDIHQKKAGTPTMGGLVILCVFLPLALLWSVLTQTLDTRVLFLLGSTLGFGLLGLVDDLLKFTRKQSLGLKARYKLLLQFIVALPLAWIAIRLTPNPALVMPFSRISLPLDPIVMVIFQVIVLVAVVNALNLTDGLDGLATGTSLSMFLPYLVILMWTHETTLQGEMLLFGSVLLGFLWFNAYPAQLFLGDSGAFSLGGFVAGLAILTNTELFLPLIAIIPVVESLSVFAQLGSYRLWRRRIFKVAPLHHHFERAVGIDYPFLLPQVEWPEPKITGRFWIISLLGALLGLLGYLVRISPAL
jgi:phospho-N-acetylmuramoyl-pentapeptide-transferase